MKITEIKVRIEGIAEIMFDRFVDHSKKDRPPEQKLYLVDVDNQVVVPSENLTSFMWGEDPPGVAKAFEGRGSKEYIRYGQSHIFIKGMNHNLTRKGKPIKFKEFGKGGFLIYKSAGRTKSSSGGKSIKQEIKPRPLISLPWELSFTIVLTENKMIDENRLFNWFTDGGILIGLGTYRPRFGRFVIIEWVPKV